MTVFPSHRSAVVAAVILTAAATLAWRDAYEKRGRKRPFAMRFVGSVI